jgi:type I restriction enzyme S subunit
MKNNKDKWPLVKFGDAVKNANLVERDPLNAGVDRVVGLEHIDPENLHIRRWNSVDDGTSFSRKFVPGQTLFGKRRAYQRKVAFAEFEGICSGDILTFEPKDPKQLLPELLPFICQTDSFFNHALGTSAGSLSPRTSWKALKEFEFPLPPIEKQKRIAEILWVADTTVEEYRTAKENAQMALKCIRISTFKELAETHGCARFQDVGKWVSGGTPSRARNEFWGGDFPWVSPKDMKCDTVSDSEEKLTDQAMRTRISVLPSECILFVVRGMILAHTFPVALTGRDVAFNQDMKGIIPGAEYSPLFLFHWLHANAARILRMTEESTHGTKRLATDILYAMKVPCPTLAVQESAVDVFETLRSRITDVSSHVQSLHTLCRTLIGKHIEGRP